MKSILLTRSDKENISLRNQLEPLGFSCIDCSLIRYIDLPFDIRVLSDYQIVVITSKYLASIIATKSYDVLLPKFIVVGENSARILKEAGIDVVYNSNNVDELIGYIKSELSNYKIIYLSGNKITKSMPDYVKRLIVYRTIYTKSLNQNIVHNLQKKIDYILIYSSESAKILIKLLVQHDLLHCLKDTTAVVMSQKIAKVIRKYFSNIKYSDSFRHTEIIDLVVQNDKK